MTLPFRFEYILYPLWRKTDIPFWLRPLALNFMKNVFPVDADLNPPATPKEMAQYLTQWNILNGMVDTETLERALANTYANITHFESQHEPQMYTGDPLRIPAQWEQQEKILISWAIMYPPIWEMHAQMAEAISPVASVEILVPNVMWANAIWLYLSWREFANMEQIQFLVLPTNDIWIRDYGPIMGESPTGQRVAINSIYDPLPQYPQENDNSMGKRWAQHYNLPMLNIDLHTEGGNVWSDGRGTLIMSEQIYYSNRYFTRNSLLDYLHTIFDFEKLIITPRLTLEETGHVDLLVKLASEDTVLVANANSMTTGTVLRKTKRIFQRETNAKGVHYQIFELPTPPLYLNWFFFTIRRGYTNSLTVNGRVLVPVFKLKTDDEALRIYEKAMPNHTIIPIDCHKAINGSGAVHCMTKEIPAG